MTLTTPQALKPVPLGYPNPCHQYGTVMELPVDELKVDVALESAYVSHGMNTMVEH